MTIDINGFSLYYEEVGSGVPVLCLPPFPFDHRIWRNQQALEDAAWLIMPDLRGTGQSSVTGGPYLMELLANDQFALLDLLGIDQVVVMGVSMGVYVAFAMYAARPERIRALVLADSRPQADNTEQAERRRRTVEQLRTEGTGMLRDRVNDLFAETTRRERPQLVEEMQREAQGQPAEGLAQISLGMAERPDRMELLSRITAPTQVICGEEDKVSPPEVMIDMANQIPYARFALIPRAGHLAPLEQPEAFNEVVREFLGTL